MVKTLTTIEEVRDLMKKMEQQKAERKKENNARMLKRWRQMLDDEEDTWGAVKANKPRDDK